MAGKCPYEIKNICKQSLCGISNEYIGKVLTCRTVGEKRCLEMQRKEDKKRGI